MALAHFCPFICPLSLIYSQEEMTFPAKAEVKCVRQGQINKNKRFLSEPEDTISEIQSVSRNEFLLLHSCDLIQKGKIYYLLFAIKNNFQIIGPR